MRPSCVNDTFRVLFDSKFTHQSGIIVELLRTKLCLVQQNISESRDNASQLISSHHDIPYDSYQRCVAARPRKANESARRAGDLRLRGLGPQAQNRALQGGFQPLRIPVRKPRLRGAEGLTDQGNGRAYW